MDRPLLLYSRRLINLQYIPQKKPLVPNTAEIFVRCKCAIDAGGQNRRPRLMEFKRAGRLSVALFPSR